MKGPVANAPDHLRFAVLASDSVLFAIRGNELLVRLIHVGPSASFCEYTGAARRPSAS